MAIPEKEANIQWLLNKHNQTPINVVMQRLEEMLDIDPEEDDVEAAIIDYLERPLTPEEIFKLRPLLMKIEDNLYQEE